MKSNWKCVALADVARLATGTTPPSKVERYFGGEIPWFTPGDIQDSLELRSSSRMITAAAITEKKAKIFPERTILLTTIGNLGRAGLLAHEASANQQITGITLKTDELLPEFLLFALLSKQQQMVRMASAATLPILNQARLGTLAIQYPIISEQRRIVAQIKECMDRIDEIEQLRAVSRMEAKQLAPSCMASIRDIEDCDLVSVATLVSSTQNGRSIRSDHVNGNGFVLSIRSVHDVSLDFTAIKPTVVPDATAATCRISEGDVFVSRANTIELVGLASVATCDAPERVIYPDLLIKLNVKRDVCLPRFLAYILRTPACRSQIRDRAVGSSQSMVKISAQRLKEVLVPLPSRRRQEALVEEFDEIHLASNQIHEEFSTSDTQPIRQAILRKAFAGEM